MWSSRPRCTEVVGYSVHLSVEEHTGTDATDHLPFVCDCPLGQDQKNNTHISKVTARHSDSDRAVSLLRVGRGPAGTSIATVLGWPL
jgi:hypothetical protein